MSDDVPSIMKQDGSVFQNFIVNPAGVIKTLPAVFNGILVSYVFDHDYDGNPVLRPVLSTICKDAGYSEVLSEAARRLFTKVEVIPIEDIK